MPAAHRRPSPRCSGARQDDEIELQEWLAIGEPVGANDPQVVPARWKALDGSRRAAKGGRRRLLLVRVVAGDDLPIIPGCLGILSLSQEDRHAHPGVALSLAAAIGGAGRSGDEENPFVVDVDVLEKFVPARFVIVLFEDGDFSHGTPPSY